MAEAIVEPIVEPVLEKELPAEPIVEPATPRVEPKKKGRPAGAKDSAPRKKKVTIVEEPLVAPASQPANPEAPKPIPKPAKQAPPTLPRLDVSFEEPAHVEPPSPRTVMRTASMSILQLRDLTEKAKKIHLQDVYTKRLHRF